MASLIPGYEYDIFISYRQKDNKGDRWVSQFVEALKTELESTFKEDVGVYFDVNPHDGLLETHDVDESLKEKLKCLVFIPVISRTYCDPKSFAWEHEFKTFVEQASQDEYGLKVKLPNGNVASRVLPVQIHDLDKEDIAQYESVLGSVLRGIEFIYKEAGVDKPLTPDDDEKKNLNKAKYRIQIVKVAHAIKEVITSLKQPGLTTEAQSEKPVTEKPAKPERRISKIFIGSIITLFLVAAGLILVTKLLRPSARIEKSIAVLPFRNESPDQENTAFVNGLMEKTLNNLQLIKDFRVISRTSVEQYRDQNKTIPEIARELGVNYIVEGSAQKYGNAFSLSVQLIKAYKREDHLWGRSFEQEIREVDDILAIQTEIAEAIAKELEANITTDEKQLIDKIPTRNLTALDFYQKGKEEYTNYTLRINDSEALDRAQDLYLKALDYDSTFAQAYIGLAWIYWEKNYSSEFFTGSFMDSVMMIIDKALSYDNQLSEAYTIRGKYYFQIGKPEQAIMEFDRALKYNPNDWEAYLGKGELFLVVAEEMDKAILNFYHAYSTYRGPQLPIVLNYISLAYQWAGFMDQANMFDKKIVELTSDSATYFQNQGRTENYLGNYEKAVNYWARSYAFDSTRINTLLNLGEIYSFMNQNEKSLTYFIEYINLLKASGSITINSMHRIGYAYWINGYKNESEYFMDEQKKYCYESIRLNRHNVATKYVYYDLAAVYAFTGETDEALANLQMFNQRLRMPLWVVTLIKNDPLLNSIRNEPEFQQIVRDIEVKYQAEHERVRKWLEEQGML